MAIVYGGSKAGLLLQPQTSLHTQAAIRAVGIYWSCLPAFVGKRRVQKQISRPIDNAFAYTACLLAQLLSLTTIC